MGWERKGWDGEEDGAGRWDGMGWDWRIRLKYEMGWNVSEIGKRMKKGEGWKKDLDERSREKRKRSREGGWGMGGVR